MVSTATFLSLGGLFFLCGLLHLSPQIALNDARAFRLLHNRLRALTSMARLLWHLGRTPFTLLALLIYVLWRPQAGLIVSATYLAAALLEAAIKRLLQRARPFQVIPDAVMSQPRRPEDPSFPSGDALRVWFLAVGAALVLGLPAWGAAPLFGLAVLVSLGRIVMGVHYPLDVIGGSGLGIAAAGLAQYLIQMLLFSV
ncbi:MAG: phosphatase PAP2 family protein [Anaerolineae bacterium]|nr:MAG: phosphatase PAP2 family protein [Anaerolineae bacterium]